jgi:hypothetical protein
MKAGDSQGGRAWNNGMALERLVRELFATAG